MWTVETGVFLNYVHAVNKCLISESCFSSFKRDAGYNSIVGMAREWQAEIWFNNIKENFPAIFKRLDDFKHNDSVGEPELWDSKEAGLISPSTLRYLHTLCDIQKHFGLLDNKTVVEIGIGYVGLCYMLHTYYQLENYHLVDLENVVTFARKYLNSLNMNKSISFECPYKPVEIPDEFRIETKTSNNCEEVMAVKGDSSYDLAISEFCLSEMDDEGIDDYCEKFLFTSENIYLLMNLHDEKRKNRCINKIQEVFDVELLPEFPESEWPNYVVVGKKKK